MSAGSRPLAVLLDAYGTLVGLEPPVPRLRAALAGEGHDHPDEVVAAALAAEIRHYRAHHDRGFDAASLAAFRRECAEVLAAGLPTAPPTGRLAEILVRSLRFVLLPDAVPALDALAAAGFRLAVVSNWDCSLPEELERLGVADRFEAIVASASVGHRKPDPAIFAHALRLLDLGPGAAVHCGDGLEPDCVGARRAGIRGMIVDRAGRHPGAPCPTIDSLVKLAPMLADDGPTKGL